MSKPNAEDVFKENQHILNNPALKKKAKMLIQQIKNAPAIDKNDKNLREVIQAYITGDTSHLKDYYSGSVSWLVTIIDSTGNLVKSISNLANVGFGGLTVYASYEVLYLFYNLIFGGCLFLLDLIKSLNPIEWITVIHTIFSTWPEKISRCYSSILSIQYVLPYLLWLLGFYFGENIIKGSWNSLASSVGKKQLSAFEKDVSKLKLGHKHKIEEIRERGRVNENSIPPRPPPSRPPPGRLQGFASRIRRMVRPVRSRIRRMAARPVRSRIRRNSRAAPRNSRASRSASRAPIAARRRSPRIAALAARRRSRS